MGGGCSGGCRVARAERDDDLLGGVVSVQPYDGEDVVWFVFVLFS